MSLYDSLSVNTYVIVMGDFSGGPALDCLFNEKCSAEALDLCVVNTYDHLPPIMVKLNQP